MRTIKFRAISMCSGEHWVYGDLRHYNRNPYTEKWTIHDPETGLETDVDEETIGQFYKITYCGNPTPVDLYEGDIVEGYQPYNEDNPHKGKIIWYNNDRFSLLTTDNYIEDLTVFTITKKLGNIHDNPELLKGGKQ